MQFRAVGEPRKGQFNSPHGFCLGMEEDIVVADTNNHRIQIFEKTGQFKYQFGTPGQFLVQSNPSCDSSKIFIFYIIVGREEGQLWYPRQVAVTRQSGKYVVCDRGNERSRMQIFTKIGTFYKEYSNPLHWYCCRSGHNSPRLVRKLILTDTFFYRAQESKC